MAPPSSSIDKSVSGRRSSTGWSASHQSSSNEHPPSSSPLPVSEVDPELLWHLDGHTYDFSRFVDHHPGGREAILTARGLDDATALFQSYHPQGIPDSKLLPYRVQPAKHPSTIASQMEHEFLDSVQHPKEWELEFVKKAHGNDDKLFPNGRRFTFSADGFYASLRKKVVNYFRETGVRYQGNFETISIGFLNVLGMFIFTYYAYIRGSYIGSFLLGIIHSLLIVRSVHSSSHHAFSPFPRLNSFMHRLSMSLVGSTPEDWTRKHIILHHVDTNVYPSDKDTVYPMKRILPYLPRLPYHRFQFLYVWPLYAHTIFAYNFADLVTKINKIGRFRSKESWIWAYFTLIAFVIRNYVIPFTFLPFWQAAVCVYIAGVSCSIPFSIQFAVNHEIEDAAKHELDSYRGDWGAHQVRTSYDYAPTSWFWVHFSGGLNCQVAHHLFPGIHFVHYPVITKMIQETCSEFKVPYSSSPSLWHAVKKHVAHLYNMGKYDIPPHWKEVAKKNA